MSNRRDRDDRRAGRPSAIATMTRPDQDTLVLRTFWSPLPTWVYGTAGALVVGGLGALVGVAIGADGNDIEAVALVAALVGYLGAAMGWAVAGVAGGDVQEITFDQKADVARVHQSLLWLWRKNWSFELDEAYRVHVWRKRGRFLFKLSEQEVVDLTFTDEPDSAQLPTLNLGRYPSELEGLEVGRTLADFLGLPLARTNPSEADG